MKINQFELTILRELADIHTQLATLTDFVIETQSHGEATPERKRRLAQRIQRKSQKKFELLCAQAGVTCPPENQEPRQ